MKKRCGPIFLLKPGQTETLQCILDATPRHTTHLSVGPNFKEKDRDKAIAYFKKELAKARCRHAMTKKKPTPRERLVEAQRLLEEVCTEHGCEPGVNAEEDELLLCTPCLQAMKWLCETRGMRQRGTR